MKNTAILIMALVATAIILSSCGVAYPPPKDATQEVVALLLIAREVHDLFWLILALFFIVEASK